MDRNLWGEWVDTLCDLVGINQLQLAREAGVDQSTISFAMRHENRPSLRTAKACWEVFERLAAQREDMPLPLMAKESFLNAAGHISDQQAEYSRMRLYSYQVRLKDIKRIAELEKEVERFEAEKAQLLEQLEQERIKNRQHF